MNKQFISGLVILALGTVFSMNVFAEGDLTRGEASYKVCVACHGENGGGRKITNAPRIAGQQSWYLTRQLNNFRHGIRGSHIKDIPGMQMRPMALSLVTEQEVEDVVAYIDTLNGRGKHTGVAGDTNIVNDSCFYARGECIICARHCGR